MCIVLKRQQRVFVALVPQRVYIGLVTVARAACAPHVNFANC